MHRGPEQNLGNAPDQEEENEVVEWETPPRPEFAIHCLNLWEATGPQPAMQNCIYVF